MERIEAACHCKKVKWSFSLPIKTVVQCHCQNCRKMQGGDYSSWVFVENSQFSIDTGSEHISHYDMNERSGKAFCSLCGTTVYGINGKHFKEYMAIPLGVIETYLDEIRPQIQVYTEHKAAWTQIHDGVPVFRIK